MEFRLLGPVEVLVDGKPVALGAPKQRALLAELLLHRGEVVTRERLIDALWGEDAPDSALSSLQVYVHGLRRALGAGRIETRGAGYRIVAEPEELDAERFERLVSLGARSLETGSPAGAARRLREALDLWRGTALADLAGQPVAAAAAALEERRLVALELRGDADLQLGRHDAVLAEIEQLIAREPYRERLRAQWILALYRAGRQKDALDAYRATRDLLVDELGVEPGPTLQELEQAVLRQDPSLDPPAATTVLPGRRLPAPPTPLVGRRLEVAAVAALLREPAVRLVTLTGPGGAGKTRLALAAAAELEPELPAGAVFVDLSALTETDLVLPEIADAVGLPDGERPPLEAIAEHARVDGPLLVVDNFEQVHAAAGQVGALLAAAPGLRILATSRIALRLSGEHEYPVPPLPTDDAVSLFEARARALDPAFEVTDANIAHVANICRRVDGLPLAIELAAARTRVLPPAAIAERLGRALDLLTEGARDLPERQRTLRATLDWSYRLLPEEEQALLARLSVWSGGATLDAAEAVLGVDPLAQLASLVDNSLVRRIADDPPRFALLETIREYAAEQLRDLGEADEYRRRHLDHFLAVAEAACEVIVEGGEAYELTLEQLERDHDNLRAAFAAATETREVELEARLAIALRWFWIVRGHLREGRATFEHVLADACDAEPALRAPLLAHAGMFPYRQGDLGSARSLWEEALELYRALGDRSGIARCTAELGGVAFAEGDLGSAAVAYNQARDLFEELGEPLRAAIALANLAAISELQGDHVAAVDYGERAIAQQRALGDLDGVAVSHHNIARARMAQGEHDRAHEHLREAFELAARLGYREVTAYSLETAAELHFAAGDPERAARLLGASDELFAVIGVEMGAPERAGFDRIVAALTASFGDERVAELITAGRELDVGSAVAEASSG